MGLYRAALASLLLLGCRGSAEPPASILSLVPAAMQTAGPGENADDHTRCLMAGASVKASVHLERPTLTIVVVAFTSTPDKTPSYALRWDARFVAAEAVRTVRADAFVHRVEAEPGERTLRIEVPPTSPGVLCLNQVVLIQP